MIVHIIIELASINSEYEQKLKQRQHSDKAMFSLAWDIQELKKTHDECHKFISKLSNLSLSISKSDYDTKSNVPYKLSSLQESLKILKAIFWYKRKPATHAFIFKIASDRRDTKPYAMHVQCIPCAGLMEEIR